MTHKELWETLINQAQHLRNLKEAKISEALRSSLNGDLDKANKLLNEATVLNEDADLMNKTANVISKMYL